MGSAEDRAGPGPPLTEAGAGLVPAFSGADSVLLATGMLGATVMPHVSYPHSALDQHQHRGDHTDRHRALRTTRVDIAVPLGLSGLVNVSARRRGRGAGLGQGAALAFALLASGLAASRVGTYSGQIVMEGFSAGGSRSPHAVSSRWHPHCSS